MLMSQRSMFNAWYQSEISGGRSQLEADAGGLAAAVFPTLRVYFGHTTHGFDDLTLSFYPYRCPLIEAHCRYIRHY